MLILQAGKIIVQENTERVTLTSLDLQQAAEAAPKLLPFFEELQYWRDTVSELEDRITHLESVR